MKSDFPMLGRFGMDSTFVKSAPSRQIPQPVTAPLTRAAIFLVVTITRGEENSARVRSLCRDASLDYLESVGFRSMGETLSCVMSIGSNAWDRLFENGSRPKELTPFQ